MKRWNVLVFPCGSEIGLEIHRSLKYSTHINLFGASSTDDHGKFVYDKYVGQLPFIGDDRIIDALKNIVGQFGIDAIYPAMDSVICKLKNNERQLGCKIICSNVETTEICLSKRKTYELLSGKVKVPKVFASLREIENYPVFVKPDIGFGSKGTFIAHSVNDLKFFARKFNIHEYVILEYLPFAEYTVDCFSNYKGNLLFVGPRHRNRIWNGISVNTKMEKNDYGLFYEIATVLNKTLSFNGAWFFQMKRDINNQLTLMEIASRLGGSSSLFRAKGINFALLSVFDSFNVDVEIVMNGYDIELDRALDNKYMLPLEFSTVYVDYDDCLIINDKLNKELICFLFQAFTNGKKLILISKHVGDLKMALKKHRLDSLFDEVIQLRQEDEKHEFIHDKNAIFIDDSFSERKMIASRLNIPVFSTDMVECLIR